MQETLVQSLGREFPLEKDRLPSPVFLGFPCGSAGKEFACNVGNLGSIPVLGRSPGEGKGYPLQYSGLENFMDRRSLGSQRAGHGWVTFTFTFKVRSQNMSHWAKIKVFSGLHFCLEAPGGVVFCCLFQLLGVPSILWLVAPFSTFRSSSGSLGPSRMTLLHHISFSKCSVHSSICRVPGASVRNSICDKFVRQELWWQG